ncbi:MAG: hypothetical protein C4B56_05530 [Candidatus Methanophagaceae archaeon]|nr:MAG: hypothetical protein C4B56_05530 [Methanophagales archaeon]
MLNKNSGGNKITEKGYTTKGIAFLVQVSLSAVTYEDIKKKAESVPQKEIRKSAIAKISPVPDWFASIPVSCNYSLLQ